MSLTVEQAKQAKDHLVTVEFAFPWSGGGTAESTITGILDTVVEGGEPETFMLGVTSAYRPGSYDFTDERAGSREGLMIPFTDVIGFTDHGDRSDALLHISHKVSARDHALQALKDAEDDLRRAYESVTNLTAQEG